MTEPVSLALIGAGRMGRMHLRALAGSELVRITSIVDPVEESRAAAHAVDPRPRVHADLDAALADGVEGVVIAAPTPLHRRLVTACAERGMPILCEKPCGGSLSDIDAAAGVVGTAGVWLQIGYWRRYVPELVALRREIGAGQFGEILQLTCAQWDEAPPAAAFRESSGGIAIDMGVHELDQARWLTNRELSSPVGVTAAGQAGADVDCAVMTFDLERDGVAMVSLGRYFPHGDCVWVELMGTDGYARVEVLWGEGKTWDPALRAQAEDFAHCIKTGEHSAGASADDARRALELAAECQSRIDIGIA